MNTYLFNMNRYLFNPNEHLVDWNKHFIELNIKLICEALEYKEIWAENLNIHCRVQMLFFYY